MELISVVAPWSHSTMFWLPLIVLMGKGIGDVMVSVSLCCFSALSIEVILGAHDVRQSEPSQVSIASESHYAHENYNSLFIINDIALIKLSEPAPLNGKLFYLKITRNLV